ncbi:Nramp family divalent metal transporter [Streptomyces sp. NPDC001393]
MAAVTMNELRCDTAVPIASLVARGPVRGTLAMFGPAFVAAIAYVDPGNFATNMSAGAEFGYRLIWVVVLANLMAMPVQFYSAKVGIVTGKSLPELCASRYRPVVRWVLWAQAELVAMATDLAEFVGAALGLNMLFGVPLLPAGLITGAVALAVLRLQVRGSRPFERAIAALLLIVMGGFGYELLHIGTSPADAASGLVPALPGKDEVFLAVGIVGATVMPHAIYLHSALTSRRTGIRDEDERRRALRFERWDVIVALGLAGIVNLAMLMVAAKVFHATGNAVSTLEDAHAGLARMAGGTAALVFSMALLVSGISASSVGTLSGQVVMSGFVRLRIPLLLRRIVTMLPSLAVLAIGLDTTVVLNVSQVALSLGIPFALAPLIAVSRDRRVMGPFANTLLPTVVLVGVAVVITVLNAVLLVNQFLG